MKKSKAVRRAAKLAQRRPVKRGKGPSGVFARVSACGVPSPKPELTHRRWTGTARDSRRYQWPVRLATARYVVMSGPVPRGTGGGRASMPVRRGRYVPPNERFAGQPQFRRDREAHKTVHECAYVGDGA